MSFAPTAQLWIDADGHAHRSLAGKESVEPGDPIEAIARFVSEAPPFDGTTRAPRTVGFLGYDLGPILEPHLAARQTDDEAVPRAYLARYDAVASCVALDRTSDAPCRLVIDAISKSAGAPLLAALAGIATPDIDHEPDGRLIESPQWAEYRCAIARALDYIAAGDVYQVNLARRFRVRSNTPPADAYLALRAAQPVSHGAFLDCDRFAILSNSPERFLRVHGEAICTEPIKGTRPRHPRPETDLGLSAELRADPKERAEHVMIVDLERNDLGRICESGSVHATSLLRLESFTTLHHLVSTVEGRLHRGTDLATILRATFPGGSITGAPKIRATEVIEELEPHGRGLYTGSLVWFRAEDDFDSSIAIRTAIARDGIYSYHAGGGIVADSDAHREFEECWLKARAFLTSFLGPDAATALSPESTNRRRAELAANSGAQDARRSPS